MHDSFIAGLGLSRKESTRKRDEDSKIYGTVLPLQRI